MSVYIYTLPKAGTYFLAAMLSNLGLRDTGYHMAIHHYLDTGKYTLRENIETPGIAFTKEYFGSVMNRIGKKDVIFGHAPLPFNRNALPEHMKILCSYRHPRKTLVSEFIDFRFRRLDVPWLSGEQVPDDRAAFELYLERHGLGPHLELFKDTIRYHSLMHHPLLNPEDKNRAIFVNFETVLRDPAAACRIAEFLELPLNAEEVETARQKTLAGETKTKAVDIGIDREALWSDRAEELFSGSDFPRAIQVAQEQRIDI